MGEAEISEALAAASRSDPDGSKSFVASHMGAVARADNKTAKSDHVRRMDTLMMYLVFRWGGMGYGPRLRQTKDFFRHGAKLDGVNYLGTETFAVTQSVPLQMGKDVEPMDWEEKVLLPNAGTLDSVLQGGASGQYDDKVTAKEVCDFFMNMMRQLGIEADYAGQE